MKTYTLFFICLLTLHFSARAQENDHSFSDTFKVSQPAQLVVSSDDGNIEVLPSDKSHIEVYYILRKNNKLLKISRVDLKKEVTLVVTSSANGANISISYPSNLGRKLSDGLTSTNWNNRIVVNLKIYVPKQTACNLRTSDGNIRLDGLSSNQVFKTSDGNIHVSNIKGSVKGHTSDGNIVSEDIRGPVDLKTSDGDISLEDIAGNVSSSTSDGKMQATNIKGDLSLKTSDGHIQFSAVEGSVFAHTSDGSIKGDIIKLHKELTLETGDGNIDVTIPDGLGLQLDIKAESIHTSLKNFQGHLKRK
jgi:hypothetical protein